jgi:hypothetical protein
MGRLSVLKAPYPINGARTSFGIISGLFTPLRDIWLLFVPLLATTRVVRRTCKC